MCRAFFGRAIRMNVVRTPFNRVPFSRRVDDSVVQQASRRHNRSSHRSTLPLAEAYGTLDKATKRFVVVNEKCMCCLLRRIGIFIQLYRKKRSTAKKWRESEIYKIMRVDL